MWRLSNAYVPCAGSLGKDEEIIAVDGCGDEDEVERVLVDRRDLKAVEPFLVENLSAGAHSEMRKGDCCRWSQLGSPCYDADGDDDGEGEGGWAGIDLSPIPNSASQWPLPWSQAASLRLE